MRQKTLGNTYQTVCLRNKTMFLDLLFKATHDFLKIIRSEIEEFYIKVLEIINLIGGEEFILVRNQYLAITTTIIKSDNRAPIIKLLNNNYKYFKDIYKELLNNIIGRRARETFKKNIFDLKQECWRK